jgi:hypothetical protein
VYKKCTNIFLVRINKTWFDTSWKWLTVTKGIIHKNTKKILNSLIFLFSYWAKNVHFPCHCNFPWLIFVIFLSFPFYLYSIFLSSFLPDHNWSYHWSHAQARMKPSHWNYHLLFICLFSNGGNWFDHWDYHFLLICKSVFFFVWETIDLTNTLLGFSSKYGQFYKILLSFFEII